MDNQLTQTRPAEVICKSVKKVSNHHSVYWPQKYTYKIPFTKLHSPPQIISLRNTAVSPTKVIHSRTVDMRLQAFKPDS